MATADEPTFSKGVRSIREAFDQAKQIAKKHETGMCWVDPFGVGCPLFVVFAESEWEEWLESPYSMLDQSDAVLVDVRDVIKEAMTEHVQEVTNGEA